MAVRACFYVYEVAKTQYGSNVKMRPVTKGTDEEKAFFAATPSGDLTMNIKNEVAADQFDVGKEFYLTFTEFPKA